MNNNFTTLRIWSEAKNLVIDIYNFCPNVHKSEKYNLINQIKRSATSIAANIAESQGRYYYKDRQRVMYIARGELYETQSHLEILYSLNQVPENIYEDIKKKIVSLCKQINAYIKNMPQ